MSSFRIGNVELANHVLVGPMAGISNLGYRLMIKQFGPGMIYSEMISDKAITYNNKKTLAMTRVEEAERPLALQLFGNETESMVQAARYLDEMTSCDIIDINMGCPMSKIVNNHSGCALMKEPQKAHDLVKAIVESVRKPVTVKLRAGWDESSINVVEMAVLMEKAGAAGVCIHPRTRTQFYGGHSDWDLIRQVKESVKIPVIGNGDIKSVEDMVSMYEQTECDAIMVSRGVLGNPWLVSQLVHYEETGEILPPAGWQERIRQCLNHAQSLMGLKGEKTAIKEMRGHACWYINGLPYNNRIKALINNITKYSQLEEIMNDYLQLLKSEENTNG